MVGNIMSDPIKKSSENVLKSYRSFTDLRSARASPAYISKQPMNLTKNADLFKDIISIISSRFMLQDRRT